MVKLAIFGTAIFVGLFILMGEIAYRYFLPAYPFFIITALFFIAKLFKQQTLTIGIMFIIGISFRLAWYPSNASLLQDGYLIRPPEDLRYRDIITLGQQTSRFIQTEYPKAKVFGARPESYQLTEPYQGYVDEPIQYDYCNYYQPHPNQTTLVFHHLYSPFQPPCSELLQQVPEKTLVGHFEENDLWVEIYEIADANRDFQLDIQ